MRRKKSPSVSLLACLAASGPLVATYHTNNPRSRILTVLQGPLQMALEKVWAVGHNGLAAFELKG